MHLAILYTHSAQEEAKDMNGTTTTQLQHEVESQRILEKEQYEAEIENLHEQLKQQEVAYENQKQTYKTQIEDLQDALEQTKQHASEVQNISELVQQYEFVVPEYSKLKKEKRPYHTPPMYSYPGGYKFGIEVLPYGVTTGLGSHVSVRVFNQIGEYDEHLPYPVNVTITLQLLNQKNKREGYHEKQLHLTWTKKDLSGQYLGSDPQFIGHGEMERKASLYIQNDKLWFRITEIKIEVMKHGKK